MAEPSFERKIIKRSLNIFLEPYLTLKTTYNTQNFQIVTRTHNFQSFGEKVLR